jgi:pimeloyl-ACP methyl ester carboxylesterase
MARKKSSPAKRKPAKAVKKKTAKSTIAKRTVSKTSVAKTSAAKPVKKTTSFITLFDMKIEVERRGKGRPLVLIPGEEALEADMPFIDELARKFEVIIPWMPGFGRSERPDWLENMDDVAYVFLDLLDKLKLKDVTLVGFSLGGWIAAEMAVKCTGRVACLILIGPLGIKVGDRETRDIPDIFALHPDEVVRLQYHDAVGARVDHATLSDDRLTVIARNREATALYAWEPYFHDPKLRRRLHRITVPTLLLWGAEDRFVTADYYGAAYRDAIPGARLDTIAGAGHFPHLEQPAAVAERVRAFALP